MISRMDQEISVSLRDYNFSQYNEIVLAMQRPGILLKF
jgi:hypothetical protein